MKTIFWDFDGVLMNSNEIRDKGFEQVLAGFPSDEVSELMDFHRKNGGLSRYVKFRYFFEQIRGEEISELKIHEYAKKFSIIMLNLLLDKNLLIEETVNFVKNNYQHYRMHIVSGSDQNELRIICDTLDIAKYFKSINGSPTPKNNLVKEILIEYNYEPDNCVLIGDSINDFEAARINGIGFVGFGADIKILEMSNRANFLI